MTPRLTVVEHVYFGDANGVDHPADSQYTRTIESEDGMWTRTKRIGEQWEALECGWVTNAALLLLRNDGAALRPVNPTPEEKVADSAAVIEVALGDGQVFTSLAPGESLRLPNPVNALCIRCAAGIARYTVRMVPK